ncbi:MAG: hypothetical protein HMLIMOIP_000715 [Candidatus Nitrosomirales archaeon]|jgi:hypothetical protein
MAHIQKLGMMNMVREEREKLTAVAKELLALLDIIEKQDHQDNAKYTEVRTKTLDLLKLLANIGGFCDTDSQDRIRKVAEIVTASIDEAVDFHSLRKICGIAVGLQVDFNKSPFMIAEFDTNVLSNEFRNMFKK